MCGLFGFSDPKHTLTQKQIRRLTGSLATASEQRGTDASGIAYVQDVYKRQEPPLCRFASEPPVSMR